MSEILKSVKSQKEMDRCKIVRGEMLSHLKRVLCLEKDIYFLLPIIVIYLLGSFIAETRLVVITMFTYFLFVLPGFVFFKLSKLSTLACLIYGTPLGISITSLLIMLTVPLKGWNILSIFIVYLIVIFIMIFFTYAVSYDNRDNVFRVHRVSENSINIPFCIFLFVSLYIITVFFPLKNAGSLTEHGHAFTGLFSHDFILRGVKSVALAKGIPNDNYYFYGLKPVSYTHLTLPTTPYV